VVSKSDLKRNPAKENIKMQSVKRVYSIAMKKREIAK
jgi:hypothetical protein